MKGERLVALLRGINVGGSRPLAMGDLRAIFEGAGCEDVVTYIQSGNVVFAHERRAGAELERLLEEQLAEVTGYEIAVLLRSASQLERIVANNPYPDAGPTHLVAVFLRNAKAAAALRPIDAARLAPEAFVLSGSELYLYLPNGQGRAKLPQALRALEPPNTARNWQTVTKLLALAAG